MRRDELLGFGQRAIFGVDETTFVLVLDMFHQVCLSMRGMLLMVFYSCRALEKFKEGRLMGKASYRIPQAQGLGQWVGV
jgi:hypothetical protein